jgi:hypothetical protein
VKEPDYLEETKTQLVHRFNKSYLCYTSSTNPTTSGEVTACKIQLLPNRPLQEWIQKRAIPTVEPATIAIATDA